MKSPKLLDDGEWGGNKMGVQETYEIQWRFQTLNANISYILGW